MDACGAEDAEATRLALTAGAGDRAAAARFVRATQQDVWRLLVHLAGPAEAEDLTQETYLRALGSLPGFAGRASARTWLLSIARRVAADRIRTIMVRPRHAALDDWRGAAERAQPAVPDLGDTVALTALLHEIPIERREAFVLTQMMGLPYAEAAHVCDCPIGTIRSRVARAREDLVAALHGDERADRDVGGP